MNNAEVLPSRFLGVPGVRDPIRPLPDLTDAAALLAEPPDVPEVLVEGLIHRRSKVIFGGGSKTFKTWILLDLAISVASNAPFWRFPTTAGRVAFVNFELQDAFIASRITEILKAKSLSLEPGALDIWNLRGHAADLSALKDRLTSRLLGQDYSLIILDPVYKLLGGREENSNTEVAQLLNELEEIAERTGAAIVFGHHFSKGSQAGKEAIDRVSGAGAWARDPDTIITLTTHDQEGCFVVDMILRNFPPRDSFVVRRDHPLMVRDNSLDASELKKRPGARKKYSVDQVVGLLPDGGLQHNEWKRLASSDGSGPKMSEGTFQKLRKQAEEKEMVKKDTTGRWCRVDQ